MKKEYTNGELTIVWEPKKCIHAGACVRALPNVYKPKEKPWITIENATTAELKAQIEKCPSGALSYIMNGEETNNEAATEATKIEIIPNGPMIVFGDLEVKDAQGNCVNKTKRTTFCRCGASSNKPYCDGAHRNAGFEG